MSQAHVSKDDNCFLHPQAVTLPDLKASGYILDIGGGAKGAIGQPVGHQVIALIELLKPDTDRAQARKAT